MRFASEKEERPSIIALGNWGDRGAVNSLK